MRTRLYFLLSLLLGMQMACDKACKKTVQDFATIENRTGRAVTFRVCKTTKAETQMVDVAMTAQAYPQTVSLGEHREYEIKGGPSFQGCQDQTETSQSRFVTLSPSGFSNFKLCYESSTNRSILIEKYQVCPTGTLEQIVPGDCAAP